MNHPHMLIEIDCWVQCGKGTKSGWGKVKHVSKDRELYEVEFPPCGYPASMTQIEGVYAIPYNDIIQVRKDEPPNNPVSVSST